MGKDVSSASFHLAVCLRYKMMGCADDRTIEKRSSKIRLNNGANQKLIFLCAVLGIMSK